MKECNQEHLVSRYYDDELSKEEVLQFKKHLHTCTTCQAALASFQDISGILDAASPNEASAEFTPRLHALVEETDNSIDLRFAQRMLAIAATMLLTTSLFWAVGGTTSLEAQSDTHWAEYMLGSSPTIQTLEEAPNPAATNFADWMALALSEDTQ